LLPAPWQLAEEIISNLASGPQAELKITVEINADFQGSF
jgi:hypothetical protein